MTTDTATTPRSTRGRSLPKWAIPLGIAVGVLLLVVGPLISSRNRLIDKDEAVNNQFAQVDVVLQRRAELIPQLAVAVKAALKQEQDVFGEIARARTQYGGAATEDEKVAASNSLSNGLGRLLLVVEAYPDLKSNGTITNLMTEVTGTDNRIAQERRNYNDVATEYNRSIRRFPTSIVAGLSGFDRRSLLEPPQGSREVPKIDLDTPVK